MIISWFSAGVDSAVATKLALKTMAIDRIIYTNIEDQHIDTMRFLQDCEQWYGQKIEVWQSPLKTVRNACKRYGRGCIHIPGTGASECTKHLKKALRIEWERKHQGQPIEYIWGMDAAEQGRLGGIENAMPDKLHHFPLVEKGYEKKDTHRILKASGIKRPKMYDLGYNNNNCIGCVKGGMGYFNKIRQDFPEVFADRAKMEREIGNSCIKGVFLDELEPARGRIPKAIVEDCGLFCELMAI